MYSRDSELSWPYSVTSGLVLVLSLLAAGAGLFVPGLYRDPPSVLPQLYGQDWLTLLGAVPVLTISLVFARRGSLRGYVVWLGTLGYLLYTYASYSFMTVFNELYLVYVAIFGLSLFAFAGGLVHSPVRTVARSLEGHSVWPYTALEVLVVVLVGFLWLSDLIVATFSGTTPTVLAGTGLPAPVIQTLDLAVLLPALLLSAVWVWQDRDWGFVFTGVLLVKLATLGLAVLAMAVLQIQDGQHVPLPMLVIFGLITLASLGLAARFVRSLDLGATSS